MSVAAKADAVSDHFDHLVGRGEDLTEHRLWSRPAQMAAPLNFCVSAPTQSSASAPEQSSNRSRAAFPARNRNSSIAASSSGGKRTCTYFLLKIASRAARRASFVEHRLHHHP